MGDPDESTPKTPISIVWIWLEVAFAFFLLLCRWNNTAPGLLLVGDLTYLGHADHVLFAVGIALVVLALLIRPKGVEAELLRRFAALALVFAGSAACLVGLSQTELLIDDFRAGPWWLAASIVPNVLVFGCHAVFGGDWGSTSPTKTYSPQTDNDSSKIQV